MRNADKNISRSSPKTDPAAPLADARPDDLSRVDFALAAQLRHAHSQIDDAEKRIAEMDRRIRELEDLAASDPLTGLLNRRGFEKFFDMELARISRGHSPGALFALIDLNLFKSINDTHGHLAGDACLQEISRILQSSIRMLDGAARLGGDEFALLLTQVEADKAAPHLEKISAMLRDMTIEWQGATLHFSASVGVAGVTQGVTFAEAYNAADRQLYAQKKQRK